MDCRRFCIGGLLLVAALAAAPAQPRSARLEALVGQVEATFLRPQGLDHLAYSRQDPLGLAVLFGLTLKGQWAHAKGDPSRQPVFQTLMEEAAVYLTELASTSPQRTDASGNPITPQSVRQVFGRALLGHDYDQIVRGRFGVDPAALSLPDLLAASPAPPRPPDSLFAPPDQAPDAGTVILLGESAGAPVDTGLAPPPPPPAAPQGCPAQYVVGTWYAKPWDPLEAAQGKVFRLEVTQTGSCTFALRGGTGGDNVEFEYAGRWVGTSNPAPLFVVTGPRGGKQFAVSRLDDGRTTMCPYETGNCFFREPPR